MRILATGVISTSRSRHDREITICVSGIFWNGLSQACKRPGSIFTEVFRQLTDSGNGVTRDVIPDSGWGSPEFFVLCSGDRKIPYVTSLEIRC